MLQREAKGITGLITQEQFDDAKRLVGVDRTDPGSHPYSPKQIADAQEIIRLWGEERMSQSPHSVH